MQSALLNHLDVWTSAVETRSTAGRGSSNKLNLYGIKKLRELILELAVRGQLVPQNPDDEPASVLLEKIAAEKARLIKDGKLKKQEPLPPISDDEKPFELPEGWEWTRLVEIISISSGDGLTSSKMNQEGNIPVFGGNGITGYHDCVNVTKPTLVIGRVGFYCGSVHITPEKAWITDNAFITYFSEANIYLDFLYWLLKGTNLKENDNATAQPVISGRKVYPIVVGLPPIAEQHRIVAKVNELMSLCDALEQEQTANIAAHQTLVEELLAALTSSTPNSPPSLTLPPQGVEGTREKNRDALLLPSPLAGEGLGMWGMPAWARIATHFDTLFTTEHSIDQLKQTILQLAVMGKLVPQDPNDEPASRLLQKIAAEKARLIKAGKIKKEKPLPAITDDEKPFELPNGWEWVRLGNALKKLTDGTHHSPPNTESGEYLYISAKNIKPNGVQISNATYVTKEVHGEIFSRCDPEYGDILYIKDGATTGIATINNLHEPFSMLSSVALLKSTADIFNKYLLLTLTAPYFYEEMREGMTGVAITRVTLTKMAQALIALPPLAEQHRIVAKVDELMALCDAMKAQISAAQATQLQLADVLAGQII